MKVQRSELRPYLRKCPTILIRLFCFVSIVLSPLILTILLWLEYWEEVKKVYADLFKYLFGSYKE